MRKRPKYIVIDRNILDTHLTSEQLDQVNSILESVIAPNNTFIIIPDSDTKLFNHIKAKIIEFRINENTK